MTKGNGGYVIISLKSPTIYEDIEANLYKPILLTDIVIDGVEKNDVFTQVRVENSALIFDNIYGKEVDVSDDNVVEYIDSPSGSSQLYSYFFKYDDGTQTYEFSFVSSMFFNSYTEWFSYIRSESIMITATGFVYSTLSTNKFGIISGISTSQEIVYLDIASQEVTTYKLVSGLVPDKWKYRLI